MRDFKEPYYTGPDCVCCSPKPSSEKVTKAYARGVNDGQKAEVELELDDLGEQLVRKIQKDTLDMALSVLRQERLEWGYGTMAARMIDGLIVRIEEKFENQ